MDSRLSIAPRNTVCSSGSAAELSGVAKRTGVNLSTPGDSCHADYDSPCVVGRRARHADPVDAASRGDSCSKPDCADGGGQRLNTIRRAAVDPQSGEGGGRWGGQGYNLGCLTRHPSETASDQRLLRSRTVRPETGRTLPDNLSIYRNMRWSCGATRRAKTKSWIGRAKVCRCSECGSKI